MVIGNMLRDRNNQYVATKDETTQAWRILDTWHEDLRMMEPDADIADDSPAVTILTEGAFISLVKEAARMGVLQNAAFTEQTEMDKELLVKDTELLEMRERLVQYEEEIFTLTQRPDRSESYALKEMAMTTLVKLTTMADVQALSKE
jgi:hypothetical protein